MSPKTKLMFVDQAVAFGGSIVVLAHLLKFLDRDRYSLLLITAMPDDVLATLFDSGVRIVRLKPTYDYRKREELTRRWRRLGKQGIRLGAYWFTILSASGNLRYRWKVLQWVRAERPALLHINNNCFYSAEVCALLGQPYLFHYHGLADTPLPAWRRWVLSKAATFVSISDFVTGIFTRHRDTRFQPIRTIPNPAPPPLDLPAAELQAVKQRWGLDPGATLIGIFGRLVSWKGQMEFLQAFSQVRARFPNIMALIVGDASDLGKDYEAQLRRWVTDQGLSDSVVFTGYVSEPRPLYQICDIVVHASIEPEPFGLVIVEGMSAGAAVIASSLGAAPEIVNHGVTGLIADPRSPEALAQALTALLSEPERRKRIALAGKIHAREKYAPERFAQAFDALYREILARA
jgi:glycosyltransferase involved in cell wall biosynthesis